MFSEFFSTEFDNNRLISIKEEIISKGICLTDLTESNPTSCNFNYSELNINNLFSSEKNLLYTPASKGYPNVREKISEYYYKRHPENKCTVNPDNIFLTSGTSESYSLILKLLCNPGDTILIPKPGYPLFEILAKVNNVNYKYYDIIYSGSCWETNTNTILKNIDEKTKAIIIINPNNPTGNYLKEKELDSLVKICSQRNIPIICDEVFYDYESVILKDKTDLSKNNFDFPIFILNGLSKMTATPQFKLGWIIVNSKNDTGKLILRNLEILCDSFLSVNSMIQNAFDSVIEFRKLIQKRIKSRILNNLLKLKELNTDFFIFEGGWNTILKLPHSTDEELFAIELLKKNKIFVHPGYFYDINYKSSLVISMIIPEDNFCYGLKKINETINAFPSL